MIVKKGTTVKLLILIMLLFILVIASIMIGSTRISALDVVRILLRHQSEGMEAKIIWAIRIPRILAALILGGALALAGYLLQTFFNNPIAGPFVLGISSGAKLIVAILMVISLEAGFALSGVMMVMAAFIGAILATLIVLFVSYRVKDMSILIVCGIMIGYVCSAITELIVNFADDSNIVNLHNWSMGSFAAIKMKDIRVFCPVIVLTVIMAILLSKMISVYLFGENYAYSLGINIRLFRILLIAMSSVLSATVTAYAGPISFVGIAVPHIIRNWFKTNNARIMVIASFVGGAVFCLFCDIIARSMFAPTELSISTVTAIFGAPVVISMILKKKEH